MFYNMIKQKRDEWLNSPACSVKDMIRYMEQANGLRDVQIDAVKTYLFLKIACGNQPLWKLLESGAFNTIDIDELPLTKAARKTLETTPAALALYEYAIWPGADGEPTSSKLARTIEQHPESIDYRSVIRKWLYGADYTDYLFSLPMGAGKTFLMAAFIYLDLYFAYNEPDNPAFAHNFIVFAPSGLKSSVVPSLKTIQHFDPAWVLPEPAASAVKRLIKFEVLDQPKNAAKSNKAQNPNVQKIARHQPLHELFGLVAVTNAEKVILDRVELKEGQLLLFEPSDDDKEKEANEFRHLIGRLPGLSVFIDEVHHVVKDEIKLRAVVNGWSRGKTVNAVVGFSGTPYLEKEEKLEITDRLSIKSGEISNIVHYYPLQDGIGRFLKRPVVKISTHEDGLSIVEAGAREFLDLYKDTRYGNGTAAKLGIYCGTIERLEERIYPLVTRIAAEYGLNASEAVLKYHKGNKQYPVPADSHYRFETLDKPVSPVRIVLLVQIGKEGWDCRSLTGIILSQEGDCPHNMVLQTSCRCLRQADKDAQESALIYLNESNARKLNSQLQQRHRLTIRELEDGRPAASETEIKRYSRMEHLRLPEMELYQLQVRLEASVSDEIVDTADALKDAIPESAVAGYTVTTQDFHLNVTGIETEMAEKGNKPASFTGWLYEIAKQSFGYVTMAMLERHRDRLRLLFDKITYENNNERYFSSGYKHSVIQANIRKAFYEKPVYKNVEELVPHRVSLLPDGRLTPVVRTKTPSDYYPSSLETENMIMADRGKLKLDDKTAQILKFAEETGNEAIAAQLRERYTAHPMKDKSFHYVPYRMDSELERQFLQDVLHLDIVRKGGLEVYYNGDRGLTDFKIRCYKGTEGSFRYIGMYTPDFIIVERRNGAIYRVLIVETKGAVYGNDPKFANKRAFTERHFVRLNNEAFGYNRFGYLYVEDTLAHAERIGKTAGAIRRFFS